MALLKAYRIPVAEAHFAADPDADTQETAFEVADLRKGTSMDGSYQIFGMEIAETMPSGRRN